MVSMYKNEGSEEDFQELLDSYYEFDEPKRGDIRDAEILQINDNDIVVDLGVKRDGVVPQQDLQRIPPDVLESLQTGNVIPVYVLNPSDSNGNLVVSINLGLQGQDWTKAKNLLESGEYIEAKVTGYNKGGLLVRFGRLEGFVPVSHAADIPHGLSGQERNDAMAAVIGQTIGLKVIEVNQQRRRLILSQREAQRNWRVSQKDRLLKELQIGDVITGRVTGIRDFGVFVDLGGADGLIHVSELAWHRISHPSDILSLGDEINVYVLELDHEQKRIALSLRRTLTDPWDDVTSVYSVDQIVEGTVNNVVDFGAFVVLQGGIEGLLHLSEMADGTLSEPYSYVQRGDKVTMRIVRIEPEDKRIGFTQKGFETDESEPVEEVFDEDVFEETDSGDPAF